MSQVCVKCLICTYGNELIIFYADDVTDCDKK